MNSAIAHEATVYIACIPDAAFIQPLSDLRVCGTRDSKSEMVEIADPFWIRGRVVLVQCPRPVYGKTVDPSVGLGKPS